MLDGRTKLTPAEAIVRPQEQPETAPCAKGALAASAMGELRCDAGSSESVDVRKCFLADKRDHLYKIGYMGPDARIKRSHETALA